MNKIIQHDTCKRILVILMVVLSVILPSKPSFADFFSTGYYKSTYAKFLSQALAGDTKAQNFVAYMSFYGEATAQDYEQAHHWFHVAAENGERNAQRNLGLFHARALSRIPEEYFEPKESNRWLSMAATNTPVIDLQEKNITYQDNIEHFDSGTSFEQGERIFQSFCAGCHGFDGIASFKLSPSFAKGERLEQADQRLIKSISEGKNIMPAWQNILSAEHIQNVLHYIREKFSDRHSTGESRPNITAKTNQIKKIKINQLGAKTYAKYCAGCHGFSGIAYYVNSPSFALGERMEKSNAVLRRSIARGYNIMPGWGDMLSKAELNALVEYIRTLATEFDAGIDREINAPASRYYRFTPRGGW